MFLIFSILALFSSKLFQTKEDGNELFLFSVFHTVRHGRTYSLHFTDNLYYASYEYKDDKEHWVTHSFPCHVRHTTRGTTINIRQPRKIHDTLQHKFSLALFFTLSLTIVMTYILTHLSFCNFM